MKPPVVSKMPADDQSVACTRAPAVVARSYLVLRQVESQGFQQAAVFEWLPVLPAGLATSFLGWGRVGGAGNLLLGLVADWIVDVVIERVVILKLGWIDRRKA